MIRKIPSDFVLGASLSAYQYEGAAAEAPHEPCVWDDWLSQPGRGFDARRASGGYEHYREDIELARQNHIKCLGISLSWSRLMKADGTADEAGVAHYREVLEYCRSLGIEPYVTLYHMDMPSWLAARGGWLAGEEAIASFTAYARMVFEQLGTLADHWVTMASPAALAEQGYITGCYPPGERGAVGHAVQALHHMLLAHARVVLLFHELGLTGEIGLTHGAEPIYPVGDSAEAERAAELDDALSNRMVFDAVLDGGYSPHTLTCLQAILDGSGESGLMPVLTGEADIISQAADKVDFLGLSYFTTHFVEPWTPFTEEREEERRHHLALPGCSRRVSHRELPATDWDWSIYPHGLYEMICRLHEEYPSRPLYIMECGLGRHEEPDAQGTIDDDDRIDYLRQHLTVALDAREYGCDVRGFLVWSLVDTLSWSSGYEKRYGLIHVDYDTMERRAKKSAQWLGGVAEQRLLLTLAPVQATI